LAKKPLQKAKKKLKSQKPPLQLDSYQTFSKMRMCINGQVLDLDNRSSTDFKSLSRSSLLTQGPASLGSLEKLEELIMTTMSLREKLKVEKKVRARRSQQISRQREPESTR
jgi:hypothetical protein